MKRFLGSTFLLASAVQLLVLWANLVNEHAFDGIEYKPWMLVILIAGCGCGVGCILNTLEWHREMSGKVN
jgi:hypothetical protein